ncbi:hypothetical protein MASR1M49_41340 [Pararhodobacter aggregans]
MLKPLLALFCIGIGCTAEAQSFTCPIGRRAACLEYGDTVCSTFGRCVDSNAVCFSALECNYEGFTCRSNLTECGDEYEALRGRFNTLVDDHNRLLDVHNELVDEQGGRALTGALTGA